jgi:hypothetical protein
MRNPEVCWTKSISRRVVSRRRTRDSAVAAVTEREISSNKRQRRARPAPSRQHPSIVGSNNIITLSLWDLALAGFRQVKASKGAKAQPIERATSKKIAQLDEYSRIGYNKVGQHKMREGLLLLTCCGWPHAAR